MIPAIRSTVYFLLEKTSNVLAFATAGFLTTFGINHVAKTYGVTTLLAEPLPINTWDAAALCSVFMLVDQIAKSIMAAIFGENEANRTSISLLSKTVSIVAAVVVIQQFPAEWAISALNIKITATVAAATWATFNVINKIHNYFENNTIVVVPTRTI